MLTGWRFASTSTSDNKSYYAYHTYPSKALYNPDLRWQYTNQTDLGIDMTIKGTHIALSALPSQNTAALYVDRHLHSHDI